MQAKREGLMLGVWSAYSQKYMLVFTAVTTLAFALPIFFIPVSWARRMLWPVPGDTDLVLYFGRCLGALILVVEAYSMRAAISGANLRDAFEIMTGIVILMIPLHIYGALKKIQPITETVEIAMWCTLLLLNLAFFPIG